MTRIALALALALALSSAAAAQTTTFRDPAGRITGKASTNSEGTTTFYDPARRVTGKARTKRGRYGHVLRRRRARQRQSHSTTEMTP